MMNKAIPGQAPAYVPIGTMDPTRPQMPGRCYPPETPPAQGCDPADFTDPTILPGAIYGVPCVASFNAELYKKPSPAMVAHLRSRYRQPW